MITVVVGKAQQVVKGHNPGLDLTNHHFHLKDRVQQQWPQDLSMMGVNHTNATLVGYEVIAGINAHLWGAWIEGV